MNHVLRAIWFTFIGWWVGLIWLAIAMAISATIIGLPIGITMGYYLPTIMFLK